MRKRNRLKRCCCAALGVVVLLSVGGCWNYRGLDQMAIVAGMALDYDPENNQYCTTFEIIDLSKPVKEEGLKTVLLDSEGETIFDAIRNARKKVKSKLYFGHMTVAIISEALAEHGKITRIANWFLRDAECRETLYLLISQEKSAAEIFKAENLESALLSFEIASILENDKKHTLSTSSSQLYEVYGKLITVGESLSLPAIHLVYRDEKPRLEVNGTAVFRDETMVGYLSPDDSKYLLFAMDEAKGGILTVQCPDSDDDIALEIEKSKTSQAIKAWEGKMTIELKLTTDVFIGETSGSLDALDASQVTRVADAAQKKQEQRIKEVVEKIQKEFGTDILGFGKLIQKQNPALWREIKDNWENAFKELSVEVISKVRIRNTAMMK